VSQANFLSHPVSTLKDEAGREFHYLLVENPSSPFLVIHFTAFFGDWGDRKEFKTNYQGYFHRYRMLKDSGYNCLFLCDQFGATKNGTYYTGERGDLFVERAMNKIIQNVMQKLNISQDHVMTVGSSMGACGALKFGLLFNVGSILAISPHIDLDICAAKQGRELHVTAICPDGKPYSEENFKYTRQVSNLLQRWEEGEKLPTLFLHSCKDDHGVHEEQVLPLLKRWEAHHGTYYFDERETGGHGSDYCTKAVILDVLKNLCEGSPIDVIKYQKQKKYFPADQVGFKNVVWIGKVRPALVKIKKRMESFLK